MDKLQHMIAMDKSCLSGDVPEADVWFNTLTTEN